MNEFIGKHWVAIIAILGGAAAQYFQFSYISEQVNPATVTEFRVSEAVLSTKREMRWCLGKIVVSDNFTKEAVLKCAD